MKAVSFDKYGSVDVLQIIDAPTPDPKGSEVVVQVKVAGLNPGETAIREGYLEDMYHTDFPSGEGTDFTGIITEAGANVTKFKVGDEVLGHTDNRASHAEYLAANEDDIMIKPDSVSWEVAGSLYVAGTTAYASIQAVDVKAGETVVISGAAGGVGLITAQLALLKGAKVIGIAGSNYHEWLTSHGVTPIDYHEDVTAQLQQITDKIDAFIDTVGGGYVELAVNLGISKDRINTCIDFAAASKYGVTAHGSAEAANLEVVQELVGLVAAGKLDIPIAKTYPLSGVKDAYNYLAQNHDLGKVIFTIS